MEDNQLVPIDPMVYAIERYKGGEASAFLAQCEAQEIPSEMALTVLSVKPNATVQFIKQCQTLGLVNEKLVQATGIAESFRTNFTAVVTWYRRGMTLERIEQCLGYRDEHNLADSVVMLNRYMDELNIQLEENLDEILAAFAEIGDRLRADGKFPMQRLLYFILETCNGQIHEAYDMAVYQPEKLIDLIRERARLWRHRRPEE